MLYICAGRNGGVGAMDTERYRTTEPQARECEAMERPDELAMTMTRTDIQIFNSDSDFLLISTGPFSIFNDIMRSGS